MKKLGKRVINYLKEPVYLDFLKLLKVTPASRTRRHLLKPIFRDLLGGTLVALILIVLVARFFPANVQAAWMNESWLYRKAITVTVASSASDITELETLVTIDTSASGKFQSSCQDLRFTSATGKLLPYYIDSGCTTSTTKVWVSIDLVPKNTTTYTLYMYYGNPSAPAASNENKFRLFKELAGYWALNETSGNRSDSSINSSTLTDTNTVTSNPGQFSNAGQFTAATTEYLTVADNASLSVGDEDFTITAWAYLDSVGGGIDRAIACKGNPEAANTLEYCLRRTSDNTLYFDISDGSTETNLNATTFGALSASTWYFVVAWYNSTANTMNIQINNSAVQSASHTTGSWDSNNAFRIGGDGSGGIREWDGRLDDVRFYKRTLSASEISQLYTNPGNIASNANATTKPSTAAGSEEQSPGPVGYWKFDEGQGTVAKNSSSYVATNFLGTGADGACSITDGTITLDAGSSNSCAGRSTADAVNYNISSSIAAAATTINVGATPTGITAGDEILVINLRGTSGDYSNVGKYETHYITSVSGNVLTLDSALTNAYDGTTQKIMVQRIPQYTTVTVGDSTGAAGSAVLTTSAYNNTNGEGGVVFFRATGAVTINSDGKINAEAKGYTGGAAPANGGMTYNGTGGAGGNVGQNGNSGQGGGGGNGQGSGTGGAGTTGGAGGGGGQDARGGGGGGGYGGVGGGGVSFGSVINGEDGSGSTGGDGGSSDGGTDTSGGGGGGTYGSADLSQLYFGSGGGSSGRTDSGNGGIGGGIIYIAGSSVTVSGSISADGEDATDATYAASGGGAGGSVYIKAATTTLGSSLVTAAAGDGGSASVSSPGGNGGVGRIAAVYTSSTGTTSPSANATVDSFLPTGGTSNLNGFLTGTTIPTWQTEDRCVSGKCLYFDGTTSNVTVGTIINNIQTISFWVRPISVTTSALIDLDGGTHKITVSSGTISATGFTSPTIYVNGKVSSTLTVNTWNHVEITTGTAFNSSSSITLGKSSTTYLNGFIDDVKIYPYARTAAQVKTDYLAGAKNAVANSGTSAVLGSSTEAWLSNGLVGYWKMDESATPSLDSSGNGNSGTWNGNAAAAAGKFGNAISLDGTSDYLSVADSSVWDVGTGDFTITGWFNATAFDSTHRYVFDMAKAADGTSRAYFAIRNSGVSNVAFGISSTCICDASLPSTGTWHHVVAKRTNGIMSLYIDGVLSGTPTSDTTNINAVDTIRIGDRYSDDAASSWNGKLDEIRVYNRALTSAEISSLYNWAPGPVGYWDFEEKTGVVAKDKSGNGYNGDLGEDGSGTDIPTWTTGKYGSALDFDGSDDNIDINTAANLRMTTNDYTVEAWIKSSSTEYQFVAGVMQANVSTYELHIRDGNVIRFRTDDQDETPTSREVSATFAYNDGKWHHLAGTRVGSTGKIYVDGVLLGEGTLHSTNVTESTGNKFYIGERGDGGWNFDGSIDEVKVYNYARTQKQIVSDMNAGHPNVGSPVGSAIGHWKFDEGQGITANNSGNGGSALNGTLTTMASPATATSGWTQAGKFNKALIFDGDNDYVDAGSSLSLANNSFTVTAWAKRTSAGTNDFIIQQGAQAADTALHFGFRSTDVFTCAFYSDDLDTTGTYTDSNWHQWTCTYDASNNSRKIYRDGVFVKSDTAGADFSGTGTVYIGKLGWAGGAFGGTLDEIKVYNYTLTADEVKLDYNQGKSLVLGASSTDPANSAYDTFTRSNGALGSTESTDQNSKPIASTAWTFNTDVWTVSSNKATGSPTLGSELLTNGNMETGGSPVSGWTDFTATTTQVADERTGGSGSYSMNLSTGAGGAFSYQQITQAAGSWIRVNGWSKNIDASYGRIVLAEITSASIIESSNLTSSSWAESTIIGRLPSANFWAMTQHWPGTGTKNYRFDDMSAKALTLSSLFATVTATTSDVTVSADATVTSKTQGGVVLNLDSATSPANFVIAYHDGTNAHLDKAVAGTYTSLINTAATYSAGATIKVVKTGTSYALYYNGTQVGTTQTVSDSGVIHNTKHGLFSTSSTNTFDNFTLQSNGSNYEYCIPGDTSSCGAPVGQWDFNEGKDNTCSGGTNDVCDKSGNGNDGAITGATWKSGKVGKALSFDGSGDSVAIGAAEFDSLTNATFEAWFKYTGSFGDNAVIFNRRKDDNNRMPIFISSSNQKINIENWVSASSSTILSNNTITANTWYHLAFTCGSAGMKMYVNGVLQSSTNATTNCFSAIAATVENGFGMNNSGSYFTGIIDQARVFDYTRTAAQVAYDYNRGAPVGHWKFNECQGGTAYDASGNNSLNKLIWFGTGAGTQTSVGTCSNNATTAWYSGRNGKFGASLNFDGTDDYLCNDSDSNGACDDGNNFDFTGPFSMTVWIKPASGGSDIQGVIAKQTVNGSANPAYALWRHNGYASLTGYSATIGVGADSKTVSFSDSSTGSWMHLMVTFDGTTLKLYKDGVLKSSASASNPSADNSPLYIGMADYDGYNHPRYFPGQIDDVRIFNYALTATQVKNVMNEGFAVRYGPATGSP